MRLLQSLVYKAGLLFILASLLILSADDPVFAQNRKQYLQIAKALEREHDYEQALAIYKKIYEESRTDINVIRGIKNCYLGLLQYDELVQFLINARKTNPRDFGLTCDLAEAYYYKDQNDKSMNLWQGLLNKNPKNIGAYRSVASSMIKMRMYDDAIKVYLEAVNQIKGQHNLQLDIANLYKIQLKYPEATIHLLEYYKANPKQFNYIQGQILGLADEPEFVIPITNSIKKFIDDDPDQTAVREILANLYIKDKKFELALDIYQTLDNDKSQGSFLAKFAVEATKNNAIEYALEAYELIIRRYPKSSFALNAPINIANNHMRLAYRFQETGEQELAGQEMQLALFLFDSLANNSAVFTQRLESRNLMGDIYAKFYFDLDKSIYYYQNYINKQRKGRQRDAVILKLGDIYLTKNQLDEAAKTYARVTQKEYIDAARFKGIEILYYQSYFTDALSQYQKLQGKIQTTHHLYNNILDRIQSLNSFSNDSLSFSSFVQAELLIYQQKLSEGAKILSTLAKSKKKISPLAGRTAGKIFFDLKKLEDAADILQFVKETYPDDIHADEVIYYLARVQESIGNYANALNLYTELLTKYNTSLYISEAREQARIMNDKIKEEQI